MTSSSCRLDSAKTYIFLCDALRMLSIMRMSISSSILAYGSIFNSSSTGISSATAFTAFFLDHRNESQESSDDSFSSSDKAFYMAKSRASDKADACLNRFLAESGRLPPLDFYYICRPLELRGVTDVVVLDCTNSLNSM